MIIGHQKQWQFLKKSVSLEKISHAYLFSGQEKLGKKTVALEFAKLINGTKQKKGDPDLILIKPEIKTIQIAQIRALIWKLSLKPYSAPFKIAIIDKAHCLTAEAQNALLKTLEEPKKQTILILITEYPETLFSTIRSRCEVLRFFPVKKGEIETYLREKGLSQQEAERITGISLGKPGEAIDFISNPQKLEDRKKTIEELITLSKGDLASRFQYVKTISKEPNLNEILKVWMSYLRNILISSIGSKKTVSRLHHYSFSKLKNILEQMQKTNFLISTTNINPKLALEVLMLEF